MLTPCYRRVFRLRALFGVEVVRYHERCTSRPRSITTRPTSDVCGWHLNTKGQRNFVSALNEGEKSIEVILSRYSSGEVTMLKPLSLDLHKLVKEGSKVTTNNVELREWSEQMQLDVRFQQLLGNFVLACGKGHAARVSISRGITSMAKLRVRDPHVWQLLGDMLAPNLEAFTPRELTNIAWAFATVGCRHSDFFSRVAFFAKARAGAFKPQHLSITAWAFASLGIEAKELFSVIVQKAEASLDRFKNRELANLAWALAKMYSPQYKPLFVHFARVSQVGQFSPQELSTTAWALAKFGVQDEVFLAKIERASIASIQDFSPQSLSNMAWAFAKLHVRSTALFASIAAQAERSMEDFNMQELSNIAWAFASLDIQAPELFTAITRVSEKSMGFLSLFSEFKPQEVANLAWALARMGVKVESLMVAIAESEHLIKGLKPQELSMIAWAFAELDMRSDVFFSCIADAAERSIDQFSPQSLANTAWAFAKLKIPRESLFASIACAAEHSIDGFTQQALANTAWSFATLNFKAVELFHCIARVGKVCLSNSTLTARSMSKLAWAFAKLNIHSEPLFRCIAQTIEPSSSPSSSSDAKLKFEVGDRALIAWAFAVSDNLALVPQFLAATFAHFSEDAVVTDEIMAQLHWVALSSALDAETHAWVMEKSNSSDLLNRCSVTGSQFQLQVGEGLRHLVSDSSSSENDIVDRGLGPSHCFWRLEEEHKTLGLVIDFALAAEISGDRALMVAIEVNGPLHYTRRIQTGQGTAPSVEDEDHHERANGSTLLKERILRGNGWEFVCVPYWEWKRVIEGEAYTRDARISEYLRTKLEPLLQSPS